MPGMMIDPCISFSTSEVGSGYMLPTRRRNLGKYMCGVDGKCESHSEVGWNNRLRRGTDTNIEQFVIYTHVLVTMARV